jgi:Carboxypeptidase regulatory-like domain/TonB-dependent Receptor Plug Domain
MNRHRFLRLVVFLLLAALPLTAQETTSSIQGTVTDPSGAVLPGVTVEAKRVGGGTTFTSTTDSEGRYRFPSLPPGVYMVTASLQGMESASAKNVEARLGASPKVDLQLRLSAVAETISVTAEAPLVDVTSSTVATSLRAESFEKLPRGRDFTSIVTQAAGASNEGKAGGISIDGATALENRFVVDGVDTTDPQNGGTGKRVITDLVDEVQIKSAGYAAEFGGATGGVINVITKTGTNNFTGSVTGYFRDRSWDGAERPTLQQNAAGTAPELPVFPEDDVQIIEPGFTLGGPILRDRLWFFAGYHPTYQTTERTVTFNSPGTFAATQTFDNDLTQQNILANVNGNIGSKLIFKAAGNVTGSENEDPIFPNRNGRSSSNPANYNGRVDTGENEAYSGYLDYIPSPSVYLSARGGRMSTDAYTEPVPAATTQHWFWRGSPTAFPEGAGQPGNGFVSVATNNASLFDKFSRDNAALEGSYFPNFMGTHNMKAGVQREIVKNSVFIGNTAPVLRYQWNTVDNFFGSSTRGTAGPGRGKYGALAVYIFETAGDVESRNLAFFAQDSWTTLNDRLTLNLGVRTEREQMPDYVGGEEYAIEFKFGDKLAPRFGFSYDVFGNGRSKVYGSYGKFYDITKLDLARGSFGGDKWVWHAFALDRIDWQNITCTGVSNNTTNGNYVAPNCGSGLTYMGSADLRHPSIENIDPDIAPMTSQELSIGFQQDMGANMAVGVRLLRKELLRGIEDLGTVIVTPDGNVVESYTIGNPGHGLSAKGTATIPGFPEAIRDYEAVELEFTRRFVNRWGLHASYVYSRLEGNYPGLASGDEAQFGTARTDPNVGRWGDNIQSLFDASGSREAVMGLLPTDRPHQFKAQLTYQLPWETTIGVNQYMGSGTPVSTQMLFHGSFFFPYGRGDLGRTPTLTQTDLYLAHRFNFGGRFGFEVSANVLNIWDEDTVTSYYQQSNTGDVSTRVTDAAFFQGFDARNLQNGFVTGTTTRLLAPDPQFNQASQFQAPREVRLGLRFIF